MIDKFESNQSGIETWFWRHERSSDATFESNQSGIETLVRVPVRQTICSVWIEPEWNWNRLLEILVLPICGCLNRTRVELKPSYVQHDEDFSAPRLNRTRVELKPCKIFLNRDSTICLNRTRVELKLQKMTFVVFIRTVWIEPEWNWNATGYTLAADAAACLNRTRVELKQSWQRYSYHA